MVISIKTLLISSILKTTKVVCGHHISRIVRPCMVDSENHKYSERVYVVKLLNTKFIWLATQRLSQRVLLLLQVSSSEKGSIVTYQGSKLTSSVNQLSNLTWLYNYIRYEIQNPVILFYQPYEHDSQGFWDKHIFTKWPTQFTLSVCIVMTSFCHIM